MWSRLGENCFHANCKDAEGAASDPEQTVSNVFDGGLFGYRLPWSISFLVYSVAGAVRRGNLEAFAVLLTFFVAGFRYTCANLPPATARILSHVDTTLRSVAVIRLTQDGAVFGTPVLAHEFAYGFCRNRIPSNPFGFNVRHRRDHVGCFDCRRKFLLRNAFPFLCLIFEHHIGRVWSAPLVVR